MSLVQEYTVVDAMSDLQQAIGYNPVDGRAAEDVASLLAFHRGENDYEDWVWIVAFRDGTRALFVGGCDYTGWDCQSSLYALPFEDWQASLRKHGSYFYDADGAVSDDAVEAVVAELEQQLATGLSS